VDAAKGYLRVQAAKASDVEHLAWMKLALSVHADDESTFQSLNGIDITLQRAIDAELQATAGLTAGPLRVALAALALDTASRNPFRLADKAHVAGGEPNHVAGEGHKIYKAEARGVGAKVGSFFRGVMVKGLTRLRPLPQQSGVHIGRIADYDVNAITALLKSQYECFRAGTPVKGKRVVLKPNLVEYHREKVINTDPRFVDAVIELMKSEGAASSPRGPATGGTCITW
jgi:hypothetical protein